MAIPSVQINDRSHHTALQVLGQGVVLGGAAGYAGKYLLPLTHEEKSSDEYVKVMDKIHKQKTEYSIRTEKYLADMKAKTHISPAEDAFIKLFDGMKEGDHVKPSRIKKALQTLEAKNPIDVADFRNICKETSRIADETAKQCAKAYKLVTKHIRPTGFFVATGAIVGATASLIGDALKTKVKD
ncbi:MAG: hypothetical protein NC191_05040 [Muribaculaceae bacterium]|nr:hypothetical protein [Muribaculaceae bacterium]